MSLKFVIVLFIFVTNEIVKAEPKLQLTVYYESKCPDSRSFILRQLQPAMLQLQEHVRTRLVPFGKAMSIDYGFGGFECQHGQQECYGNMLQDCTLHLLANGAGNNDGVDYVACEMRSMHTNSFECAKQAGVDPEKVQHCIEFGKGTMLQITSEYETSLVAPKFIPTVTVDNTFDQQVQNSAQHDLMGTLCNYLKNTKPCMNHYNDKALRYIMSGFMYTQK